MGINRQRGDLDITQRQSGVGTVVVQALPAQHHLDQWVIGQATGGVEAFDEDFERHVLVLVGGQAALAHLGEQLGDGRVAVDFHAQYQGVDEETDQFIERGVSASGDRESHGHIRIRADRAEQGRQRGLDHHEARRIVFARHLAHSLLQLGRPLDRHTRPALIGHRRVGPVGGKCQALRHSGKGIFPVGELGRDRAAGVVETTELRVLPQREIGVLQRQSRPAWRFSCAPGGIRRPQITHQRSDRGAVGGDVVYHAHQHMLVVSEAEKCRP